MAYYNGKKIAGKVVIGVVPVDDAISAESENPVQNKVVKQYVDETAAADHVYDPESEKAQSGQAVAQAIAHFDTVLKSGNTFIFDGGRPSGKIDIDLVVDSELDPQSQNPLENKRIAAELSDLDTKSNENAAGVYNLGERATTTEEQVADLDTRLTTTEEQVAEALPTVKLVKPEYGTYTPVFLATDANDQYSQPGCSMDYSYGWYYKIGRLVWFSVMMKGMVTSRSGNGYSGISLPFKCVYNTSFVCGECYNLTEAEIYSVQADNGSVGMFKHTRGSGATQWLLNQTGWVKVSGCYLTDE